MRAIDTNVLVRLMIRDDARQVAVAEAFVERGAWLSIVALAEGLWVLGTVYKRTPSEVATSIEMLLTNQRVVLQDADAVAAALSAFKLYPSLGFTDCLIVQLARKAGNLPLGTFDRALSKIEGTHLL